MESPPKEEEASSPALSLDKGFMDEIYKRCSPLKRTSFINSYVQGVAPKVEKKNLDENLEETQQIECHEVKLFSPHRAPQPITLDARLDTMSNCFCPSQSSPKKPQNELKPISKSLIQTEMNNDYSDMINLDYKL